MTFDPSEQPDSYLGWIQDAMCGNQTDLCCEAADGSYQAGDPISGLMTLFDRFQAETIQDLIRLRCTCGPCNVANPSPPENDRSEEDWAVAIMNGYAPWLCCFFENDDLFDKVHFMWRNLGASRVMKICELACSLCIPPAPHPEPQPPGPTPPGPGPTPPGPGPVCKNPMVPQLGGTAGSLKGGPKNVNTNSMITNQKSLAMKKASGGQSTATKMALAVLGRTDQMPPRSSVPGSEE